MARKAKTAAAVVADVCLYGTSWIGAGWLASTADGRRFGDGDPKAGRTFTEAVWAAFGALEAAGVKAGLVRVFEPNGTHVAGVDLAGTWPTFGDLRWQPAPSYVVTIPAVQ